ncbi:MAG: stalk domain-containing protein [Bacillota bacterium]
MRYPVELEGNTIEGQAFESDGVLYLPLRSICSHLGYNVDWHGKEKTIEDYIMTGLQ